ncbi:hypothetical protein D3C72_1876080 [compost metagenome]
MPAKTAIPMACRISAPAPLAKTSGTTPAMKASEVIRMGRNRNRHASTTASSALSPSASRLRANSTMRMAFFAARPTSTMSPIWTNTLLSPPTSQTPMIALSRHIGTIIRTARGSSQLLYCAARIR